MERNYRIGIIATVGLAVATILYGVHTCINTDNQARELNYQMEARSMAREIRDLKETRLDDQRQRAQEEEFNRESKENDRMWAEMVADLKKDMTNFHPKFYSRFRSYK